jgi:ubiquinone/menaquinone biosynthesis C-methylase UbiE
MEWLRRCLPREKSAVVLDAGGGAGKWAIPIGELGYQVIIVDISKGMLDIAIWVCTI